MISFFAVIHLVHCYQKMYLIYNSQYYSSSQKSLVVPYGIQGNSQISQLGRSNFLQNLISNFVSRLTSCFSLLGVLSASQTCPQLLEPGLGSCWGCPSSCCSSHTPLAWTPPPWSYLPSLKTFSHSTSSTQPSSPNWIISSFYFLQWPGETHVDG